MPTRATFVHQLLELLEASQWSGAPRLRRPDEQGREVLTYVEGQVPASVRAEPAVRTDGALAGVAVLVRELHDLTAGTALAGDAEVVCHNDLSPKNTVYASVGAGLRPVAFIDWDLAAPGARVHDVAHMAWQYLDLGPDAGDIDEIGRRMRLLCDAYGLAERGTLLDTVLWWQERCWRGIEAGAAEGDPAMSRLQASGVVREVRNAYDWVGEHRDSLAAALR
jgi:hypothetical protein